MVSVLTKPATCESDAALTTEALGGEASSRAGRLRRMVRLAVSLGLLGFVLYQADWSEVAGYIGQIKPLWVVLFFLIIPVNVGLCVAKWQALLAARGRRVGFGLLFGLYVLGQFFNNLLPTSIGGDAVRAVILSRRLNAPKLATGSIVVERLTGIACLVLIGIVIVIFSGPVRQNLLLVGLVGLSIVMYIGVMVAIIDPRLLLLVRRLCRRWRIAMRLVSKLVRFQRFLRAYGRHRAVMAVTMVLSVLFYVGTIGNVYLACRAIGQEVPLLDICAIAPLAMLVTLIPISINGLGLQEWAFTATFAAFGLPPTLGLSASLLVRVRNLIWSALGYLVYVLATGRTASISIFVTSTA